MTALSPHDAPQNLNMALGQLYTNRLTDPHLLQVLIDTPRENFVPQALRGAAYVDHDIEIAPGRFLLAPLTFAQLVQLAEVTPSCRVLVVGGGNGYAAAVLSRLAGHVVTIDSDANLAAQAAALKLPDVDAQQVEHMQDGYAMSAPYDAIVVCGGVEHVPDALVSQLAIGGRLVAVMSVAKRPGVAGGLGKGVVVRRMDGQVNMREHFDASTATLPGFTRPAQFNF